MGQQAAKTGIRCFGWGVEPLEKSRLRRTQALASLAGRILQSFRDR